MFGTAISVWWDLVPKALLLAAATGCAATRPAVPPVWWHGFADADTVRVTPLIDGVRHIYLWLPHGPWAVHVVEVDERVCAPLIAALKAGPPLAATALTTDLGAWAVAAVNADFFQAPGGTPVGAHVRAGRVLAGPGARPLYALTAQGAHWAGAARLAGRAIADHDSAAISQINRPVAGGRHQPPLPGLTLFDEWYGAAAPDDADALRLRLVDERGRGVVVAQHAAGDAAALDAAHVALQAVGAEATAWLRRRAVGDSVRWSVAVVATAAGPAAGSVGASEMVGAAVAAAAVEAVEAVEAPAAVEAVEAVGGFPLLVAGGRGVYAEQSGVIASFGPVRHPRTAVGWDAAGRRLFWVVVDGRQAPYSDGMSLPELEWLFLRLGASDALNLDGGGSSALAVAGRLANRPSDDEGERAVANVLALEGCR